MMSAEFPSVFQLVGCAPQPALSDRPLIGPEQAAELSGVFELLANDARLRLVHALARDGELSVTNLAKTVAMSPQAVSNHLRRLTDRAVVARRRLGGSVLYRIVDPCLISLLDLGLCVTATADSRVSR